MRAVAEPLLVSHFEDAIIDEVFFVGVRKLFLITFLKRILNLSM